MTNEEMFAQDKVYCKECGYVFNKENRDKLPEEERVINLVNLVSEDGEGYVQLFCNLCIVDVAKKLNLKKRDK
jgi:hypothetical protein